MCNYCNIEHGMIGDVVCPIKQRFPTAYVTKQVFTDSWPTTLEISWPVTKYDFDVKSKNESELFSEIEKEEVKKYFGTLRKYNKKA